MQYRLIALDLDGTLLNSQKEISPRNRAALTVARERGLLPVVATGRMAFSARIFSQQVGGGLLICCNGAAILDGDGKYLVQHGLPTEPLLQLLKLGREQGLLMEAYTPEGLVVERAFAHAVAYYSWIRKRSSVFRALRSLAKSWRLNNTQRVGRLDDWVASPASSPVLKLMLFGRPGQLTQVADQIRRELPGLEVSSSESDNLEITAAGVSKASGLAWVSQHLQIPSDAMVGVGDSDNDLEMLGYVGLGVAMGNASDRVKVAADRVTATCDEDGVALLVEELCASGKG